VIAYGLRGNVYRSDDNGATWAKVDAGLAASVVASVRTGEGATLLADAGGRIASSTDGGHTFQKLMVRQTMPLTSLVDVAPAGLALAGPRGVVVSAIAAR
jgi:photosystem II stability/assembly factor-like uncharacterized protein